MELDGGTLNLNGVAMTFRSIKGHGTIVGSCMVTEALELDGALNVTGNLTIGDGVAMKMEVADDGAALTPLNVSGALVGGSGITIDFGRYDDRAFGEMQSQIGTVGSGSSFSASAVHAAASRRTTSRVVCANGAIRLCIQPLGSVFVVK